MNDIMEPSEAYRRALEHAAQAEAQLARIPPGSDAHEHPTIVRLRIDLARAYAEIAHAGIEARCCGG